MELRAFLNCYQFRLEFSNRHINRTWCCGSDRQNEAKLKSSHGNTFGDQPFPASAPLIFPDLHEMAAEYSDKESIIDVVAQRLLWLTIMAMNRL
jgi:hypothetical protein